jgi:SAM-dependent methyltransferase
MFVPPRDLNLERHDPVSGYALWSRTYDGMLTDAVDGSILTQFLNELELPQPVSVLDFGCGTGRNVQWLRSHGYAVKATGVDISAHMKAIAERKALYDELLSPEELPEDRQFDLCLCILVSCHVGDLDWLYSYVGRRLRPQGRFFLIDMHPHLFHLGKGTYVPVDDRKIYIENHIHQISDYVRYGRQRGFRLNDMTESFVPESMAVRSAEYGSLTGHPLGIGFHWQTPPRG